MEREPLGFVSDTGDAPSFAADLTTRLVLSWCALPVGRPVHIVVDLCFASPEFFVEFFMRDFPLSQFELEQRERPLFNDLSQLGRGQVWVQQPRSFGGNPRT